MVRRHSGKEQKQLPVLVRLKGDLVVDLGGSHHISVLSAWETFPMSSAGLPQPWAVVLCLGCCPTCAPCPFFNSLFVYEYCTNINKTF